MASVKFIKIRPVGNLLYRPGDHGSDTCEKVGYATWEHRDGREILLAIQTLELDQAPQRLSDMIRATPLASFQNGASKRQQEHR